jgi:DNA replication protein DnaC
MLSQPLLDKLSALGLTGIRTALEDQGQNPQYAELTFEDRLGLLVDVECTRRADSRLQRRLRAAHFALAARLEDLDLSPKRGLDRRQILELAQSDWVRHHLNVLVLGPTGAGKTFLTCSLGTAACAQGFSVRYERTSRLLHALYLAQADGSYAKLLANLARVPLLILDDWLRDPLTPAQARDLLEILDDRYGRSATLIATQIPVADWHSHLPDPTLADSILDRLVHNAYRLQLKGDSMRKVRSPLRRNTH